MQLGLIDTGGRRIGIDRRDFSYTNYLPNRRVEEDRRRGREETIQIKEPAKPFLKKYKGRKTI